MQERQVAKKVNVKILHTGEFVQQGGMNPNYVKTEEIEFSRVRVLGTVIDKFISEDGNYGTITLDDTTDTIRCKVFRDLTILEEVEKGDLVDVIGKIKEYNEERYIQLENIAKVEDPNFEALRKLELEKL